MMSQVRFDLSMAKQLAGEYRFLWEWEWEWEKAH